MTPDSPLKLRLRLNACRARRRWRDAVVGLALAVTVALPSWAQESDDSAKAAASAAMEAVDRGEQAALYERQRQRAAAGDQAVDFTALRQSFTHTADYTSDMGQALMLNREMFQAMDRNDFARCSEVAQQALRHDYTNLQSHYGAMVCHFQLGEDEQGQHHQWVMQGLLNSLRTSGVGTDPNQPYRPINADEVDGFLRLMGYEVRSRVATQKDGQPLEVITVYDNHQDLSQQLFFDSSSYNDES